MTGLTLRHEPGGFDDDDQPGRAGRRAQTFAAAAGGPGVRVGTTIEWYDFFLYGTAAALVFPRAVLPRQRPFVGMLLAFGTQFVGFAARPIGAAIFGHFGDRIGRKAHPGRHAAAHGHRHRR